MNAETDAKIMPDRSFRFSGYEVGDAAQKFLSDDYEFGVVLKQAHTDQLMLALIVDGFGRDSCAIRHFMKFLDAKGIPCDFNAKPKAGRIACAGRTEGITLCQVTSERQYER